MDPARILQIITNSTWMVTKLVGSGPVEFVKSQYVTEVEENTTPHLLLQLTAHVQAQGESVEFRIKEGNDEGVFTLGSNTGRLTLQQPLDFEEQQQYELVVEARAGEATSEARVKLQVVDQNDHAPVFPRNLHETQITEEDDRHLPKTILTPLDRDPPYGRSQWRLQVSATDGELVTYTTVHVNLKDINDNAPYFPQPVVNATISENTRQGMLVAQVSARDNDDPLEGHNARLVYSLEKNVIDEASGRPIFAVDSGQGVITTALCCLDREKTQRYAIQVVATDGGGLKGTGTVLVEVSDVNDVPPRFSKPEWTLDVSESLTPDHVLATLSVLDQDASNNFTYRVVPGSGRGWHMFRVVGRRSGSPGGDLRVVEALDYENPDHRKGFRFRVQVTDLGEPGWQEKYHVDGTWVNLHLVDANDNSPVFSDDQAHLTLTEDTPHGTHLATFTAHDIDGGGESRVNYTISPASDPGGQFSVERAGGGVSLAAGLDREAARTHTVLVLAVDDGLPPRTATATLTVNVTDVNDNPPFLSEPRQVQVVENSSPQVVAEVKLGDPDDWRQGHGPPFTIKLDPRAPPHIKAAIQVKFDKKGDEGRGVGVVSTTVALDREERRALLVPLVVGDDGSPPLSTTVTLTLHVADLNDNPMAPAAKVITLHTVQPQTTVVPLGRVYVKDPDDWDAASKTYAWRHQHPNFTLNTTTGDLAVRPGTMDGRYELGFTVSDASQGQSGVTANVTIDIKSLSRNDVISATPLTLAADPYSVVRQEGEDGTSVLHQLVVAARAWLYRSSSREGVQVVSVHQVARATPIMTTTTPTFTRVWLTAPGLPNLQHILLHKKEELGQAVGVSITEIGVGTCLEAAHATCEAGCWARAALGDRFTVVDANTSSVVGPWLGIHTGCGCGHTTNTTPEDENNVCSPHTCLNGGRCVPSASGIRCICPHGTLGSRCKILSRHFEGGGYEKASEDDAEGKSVGGGWAWVPPVPSCAEVHLSLEFLTKSEEATLLYSGPDHLSAAPGAASDVVALELRGGRPSLLLDLGAGPASLTLSASYSLADESWHRVDLIWKDELVEMIVDLCSGGSIDGPPASPPKFSSLNTSTTPSPSPPVPPDAHTCRGAARLPRGAHLLNVPHPLQVGGLAHPAPAHKAYGWPEPLLAWPLDGCIRNLRINGELIDLGRNVLSHRSAPGCPSIDCTSHGLDCGVHGRCQGSPGQLRCECQLGWEGQGCATPTVPAAFQVNSYVKLALSFTPLAYTTTLHLRSVALQNGFDSYV
ncbi:putative neural-cadherin 2 isoform X2 [Panulirus ornatus]|uniref:putative neural-cadherin 2 isoform X2 n=1 Tax=Panulirus ornatus TaxID=150431 RepID=UPI003A886090